MRACTSGYVGLVPLSRTLCSGQLCTPFADHCLPGITRQAVIDMAPGLGFAVSERRLSLADFHAAEEGADAPLSLPKAWAPRLSWARAPPLAASVYDRDHGRADARRGHRRAHDRRGRRGACHAGVAGTEDEWVAPAGRAGALTTTMQREWRRKTETEGVPLPPF